MEKNKEKVTKWQFENDLDLLHDSSQKRSDQRSRSLEWFRSFFNSDQDHQNDLDHCSDQIII